MKQLNTFAADDLALCRSHSRAVDEHFIDPTTQEDLRRHTEHTNHWIAVSRFERGVHMPTDLPLPPDYWDALDEWLDELEAKRKPVNKAKIIGAAVVGFAPAPAADQADVWHSEPPAVAGKYEVRDQIERGIVFALWNGSMWTGCASDPNFKEYCEYCLEPSKWKWLRLVEADKPAETAAPAAATHSVCIKAHRNLAGAINHVGDVLEYEPASRHVPECWLPCDKDGWVSHTPTADSGCPVPAGVEYEDRLACGDIGRVGDNHPYWTDGPSSDYCIIAWHPTGAAA